MELRQKAAAVRRWPSLDWEVAAAAAVVGVLFQSGRER